MKNLKQWALVGACLCTLPVSSHVREVCNEPDSVYLFSYATVPDEGRSGLRFAWSPDGDRWFSVGDGYGYVRCDYGAWGAEKRMVKPELRRDEDGVWHCIWQLNGNGKEFAHAASADLLSWKRQSYFLKADFGQHFSAAWHTYPWQSVLGDGKKESGTVPTVAWEDVERLLQFAT